MESDALARQQSSLRNRWGRATQVLVAQALLPVRFIVESGHATHSQEWLCHRQADVIKKPPHTAQVNCFGVHPDSAQAGGSLDANYRRGFTHAATDDRDVGYRSRGSDGEAAET